MAFPSSSLPNEAPPPPYIFGGLNPDKFAADIATLESQKVLASNVAGDGQSSSDMPPFNGSSETGEIDPDRWFTYKTIRNGFIRKVYLILMCQLAITAAFIAAFVSNKRLKDFAYSNPGLLPIAFMTTLVCLVVISCFESVRRTTPYNYIFLFIFTVAESFLLAVFSSIFDANEVLLAVGICSVVCFALTVFAFQTKFDFTHVGGILLASLTVLIIFGITSIYWQSTTARLVYACLGALLFSVFIVYDTQLLLRGDHKYTLSPEEYVFAALNLYIDVVRLFVYILRIMRAG